MGRSNWKAALSGAAAALALARPAAADEGLALRRVLLSSGGVGYFEHEARVSGDAELTLSVRLDQIDDVLKSIVIFDDRGGTGELVLPSRGAEDALFRDLPFDPSAVTSPPALFAALRGAEVEVDTEGGTITGRVLSVTAEPVALPDHGGTVTRHRLAIAAEGSVRTVVLEEAASVRLLDPVLAAQLDAALRALLDRRERGRRTLTIRAHGAGERRVHIGYVTAVPLWKSTYRLVMPADPTAADAELIGLAAVENDSGAPYEGVDLTLVSGNPVTFHQALYETYYVARPEVPVEVAGRVLPRLDEGAVAVRARREKHERAAAAPRPGPPAGIAADHATAPEEAPPPVEAAEQATQVTFHLPGPVSIAAGELSLMPIVDRRLPAERVSLYQPDIDARHPLASILIDNDGETSLPPGALTAYERRDGATVYLGDARLAALPAGERRMITFGVDGKVTIDRRDREAQSITRASIHGGVLTLVRTEERTTEYTVQGAAREPRVVIVEQPRLEGYELSRPRENVEATADHYRLRIEVPAGATRTMAVTLARPIEERVTVADLSGADLGAYASAAELPAAVREAMARLASLRATVDARAAAVKAIDVEVARITAEQARIRDNLKVVPPGSPLAARYLAELGEEEDQLAALRAKRADAQRALDAAREALTAAIRGLAI